MLIFRYQWIKERHNGQATSSIRMKNAYRNIPESNITGKRPLEKRKRRWVNVTEAESFWKWETAKEDI
jgi:hypothetical protein